jgi:hypothetical protein
LASRFKNFACAEVLLMDAYEIEPFPGVKVAATFLGKPLLIGEDGLLEGLRDQIGLPRLRRGRIVLVVRVAHGVPDTVVFVTHENGNLARCSERRSGRRKDHYFRRRVRIRLSADGAPRVISRENSLGVLRLDWPSAAAFQWEAGIASQDGKFFLRCRLARRHSCFLSNGKTPVFPGLAWPQMEHLLRQVIGERHENLPLLSSEDKMPVCL